MLVRPHHWDKARLCDAGQWILPAQVHNLVNHVKRLRDETLRVFTTSDIVPVGFE